MTVPTDPAGVNYVRRVLDSYCHTPGTCGHVRPADRRLARDLFARAVPLQSLLDAFLLASARRFRSATDGPPPPTVRSLAYFLPVLEELSSAPLSDDYRRYLATTLARLSTPLDIFR